MKREDGFYWVKYHDRWEVAEFFSNVWWGTGIDSPRTDSSMDEIGPCVQRDSEIMKQRDEAVELLRLVWQDQMPNTAVYKKIAEFFLARIEAEKSGVK